MRPEEAFNVLLGTSTILGIGLLLGLWLLS
jgi:hypothetical protein